jgi:hypothetical protein
MPKWEQKEDRLITPKSTYRIPGDDMAARQIAEEHNKEMAMAAATKGFLPLFDSDGKISFSDFQTRRLFWNTRTDEMHIGKCWGGFTHYMDIPVLEEG